MALTLAVEVEVPIRRSVVYSLLRAEPGLSSVPIQRQERRFICDAKNLATQRDPRARLS